MSPLLNVICSCSAPSDTQGAGQRLGVAQMNFMQRRGHAPQHTLTDIPPSAAPCGADTQALLRLRGRCLMRRRSEWWRGECSFSSGDLPMPSLQACGNDHIILLFQALQTHYNVQLLPRQGRW